MMDSERFLIDLADKFAKKTLRKCHHYDYNRCSHCEHQFVCSKCRPIHLNNVRLDTTLLAINVS